MTQSTPDTIEGLCKVLRGLSHCMKVEIEPGIPLAKNWRTFAHDFSRRTFFCPAVAVIGSNNNVPGGSISACQT